MNGIDSRHVYDPVEDALRTYPLSPVPDSLKTRVMGKIRPAVIAPRFNFPWLEAAISMVCTTLLTALVSLLLAVPPAVAMQWENAARIFLLHPGSRAIVLAAASSVALSCVCLVLTLNLFRKPFAPRMVSRH